MNDTAEYIPDAYQSWADEQLLDEYDDHPERFRRAKPQAVDPQDEDFQTLVSIAADVFRVRPIVILSSPRGVGPAVDAKHLVAALWSQTHTMAETAERVGSRGCYSTQRSRKRAQKLALQSHGFAEKAAEVIKRLKKQAPSILGNYH